VIGPGLVVAVSRLGAYLAGVTLLCLNAVDAPQDVTHLALGGFGGLPSSAVHPEAG
jgi:hypothetical protein